jgi:integrase
MGHTKKRNIKGLGYNRETGNWFLDYYVEGRRIREAVGKSKSLAVKILYKRRTEVVEGKYLDKRKNKRVKFEDFTETYLENYARPHKKSAWRDEISIKHLLTHFKGKHLSEITSLMIERYITARIEDVSPQTVNKEIKCLKLVMNKAIEWGQLDRNPVAKVKFLREPQRKLRFLDTDEIGRLIDSCPSQLMPVIITALHTGMRRGEILDLNWENVDLNNRIIYLTDTKSGVSREIPINSMLFNLLKGLQKRADNSYVFTNKLGNRYRDVRTAFKTTLRNAGIKNFRFHDLRHTFASHLVMSGVDLLSVKELLGHKELEMTLRYAHLSPDHKKAAVEVLPARFYNNSTDTLWTPEENREKKPGKEDASKVLTNKGLIDIGACSSTGQSVGLRSQRL